MDERRARMFLPGRWWLNAVPFFHIIIPYLRFFSYSSRQLRQRRYFRPLFILDPEHHNHRHTINPVKVCHRL